MHHGRGAHRVDFHRSRRRGFLLLGPLREILLICFAAGIVILAIIEFNRALLSDSPSDELNAMKSRSNPVHDVEYDADRNSIFIKSWVDVFEEISLTNLKSQRIETPANFAAFDVSKKNSTTILMSQWADRSRLMQGVQIVRGNDVLVSEEFSTEFGAMGEVRIAADGSIAMFIGHEGQVIGWGLTTTDPSRWEFQLEDSAITNSLSPDGRRMVVISRKGDFTIRDPQTGVVLRSLPQFKSCSRSVTWTGDSRRFALADTDHTVFVFDAITGAEVCVFQNVSLFARVLKFSDDGQHLAIGGFDKTIRVWDCSRKEQSPIVLVGSTGQIGDFVFTEGDAKLVAGCTDGTIREWSMATHQVTRQIR